MGQRMGLRENGAHLFGCYFTSLRLGGEERAIAESRCDSDLHEKRNNRNYMFLNTLDCGQIFEECCPCVWASEREQERSKEEKQQWTLLGYNNVDMNIHLHFDNADK